MEFIITVTTSYKRHMMNCSIWLMSNDVNEEGDNYFNFIDFILSKQMYTLPAF